MIFQTKQFSSSKAPNIKAGEQQERQVAFYLQRAFSDSKDVIVLNDVNIEHQDEHAQIDHLILFPYGFILIESKSVKGQININSSKEWTRSVNNKWQGMPSPLKQVELQKELLNRKLNYHSGDVLFSLGNFTQSFDYRIWKCLCAVSSDAIIHRSTAPSDVSEQLVKAEFVTEKVRSLMKLYPRFLKSINIFDTRPSFSSREMHSIAKFLSNKQTTPTNLSKVEDSNHVNSAWRAPQSVPVNKAPLLQCKYCGSTAGLTPRAGKFGYYVHCETCEKNTPMKRPCSACGSKHTKVSKRRNQYFNVCSSCQAKEWIYTYSGNEKI